MVSITNGISFCCKHILKKLAFAPSTSFVIEVKNLSPNFKLVIDNSHSDR